MAMKNLRGRVAFKFEELDFDVDQIVGVKNIKTTNIDDLAKAAMQEYDPAFASAVKPGDLLVGMFQSKRFKPRDGKKTAFRSRKARSVPTWWQRSLATWNSQMFLQSCALVPPMGWTLIHARPPISWDGASLSCPRDHRCRSGNSVFSSCWPTSLPARLNSSEFLPTAWSNLACK